ncbi:MAG: ABC transporter substrate-binding protein [Eggerthellaceae bacterium]
MGLKAFAKRGIAVAVAAALALSLGLAGCSASASSSSNSFPDTAQDPDKTTIKIAYLPITHALPVLEEAKELSESADSDIQIELVRYGTWPELMDALDSGQVDGASVLVELAMRAVEQGIDLDAVALGHRDGNVIVARNDIDSIADLKGKTIAVPARQSSHYILVLQALKRAGLSESDVTITELAPTEMPSALASNSIQAYCVAEPFGAKGVDAGVAHVLENSEDLWENSICCAFVLNGNFVKENKKAAKELVAAYKKAGKNLSSESEALSVAGEYLNQDQSVLETSLQWISFDDLDIDRATYKQLVRRVKEAGLSDNPPSYDEFVLDLDKE